MHYLSSTSDVETDKLDINSGESEYLFVTSGHNVACLEDINMHLFGVLFGRLFLGTRQSATVNKYESFGFFIHFSIPVPLFKPANRGTVVQW